MTIAGSELAAGAGFLLGLLLAGLLAWLLWRAAERRQHAADRSVSGGAALIADAGVVTAANAEALAILGAGPGSGTGTPVGQPLTEVLAQHLGDGAEEVLAAVERLNRDGTALQLVAHHADGSLIELTGKPLGGLVWLGLREAIPPGAGPSPGPGLGPTRDRTPAAAAPAAALVDDGASGPTRPVARPDREAADMAVLLAGAPLVAWSRDADGALAWAVGGLNDAHGQPLAQQAAEAATARLGAAQPAEGGSRARLELPAADGRLAVLDVVETARPEGGCFGFAVDASAALESERTLARFVRTMTETFAHLTVGLAIFDRNQTLAMFNPALVQMWQADPAWLARRPSLSEIIYTLRANRRIPETANFHAWRRRLTGLFANTEAVDYEELWHLAGGSDIRVLARPHPHGSLAFVFDDVTERLRLERQYRHSIDLYRATLDRLDEGLAVFGPDGLLQLVNTAFHRIWGTDAETVRPATHARDVLPLVRGLTVETEVWSRLMTFITSEATRQAWTARLTLGNGRLLRARFARLPDGSTMAVFGDVTDRERIALTLRERNVALESAEEMRTAVLDRISHRLRTPLNTIYGFAQLISDSRFGALSEAKRKYADAIVDSSRHLMIAIDEVTELAALEVGQRSESAADPPLGETLILTGRLLEKRAVEEGVSLRVVPPDYDVHLPGDAGRLRQIVFSMVTDAISRCRDGGAVELAARPAPGGGIDIFTNEVLPAGRQADSARAEA